MNRKYVYIILALTILGFLLIVFSYFGNKPEVQANQEIQVETPPFFTYVSSTGTVEPASGNILIIPPFNRIVEQINVKVNDQVKKGDLLFTLYNEDLKANLRIKEAKYEAAESNLYKLEIMPREEDLAIAEQNFNKAQSQFNEAVTKYCMARRLACGKGARCILTYQYQQAEADFLAASAQFRKIRAGTWEPDLKIAQEEVAQARADKEAAEVEFERTYIKSPIDGTVLQIKIHEGEMVDQSKSALIVGNIEELNLRVSIDQLNELRFQPNCPAVAFKQGDTTREFALKFINIEPFMVPKRYLTNSLQERVDTQVFEVLYRIEKGDANLFVGEQMDVYIYVDKKEG